MKSFTLLSASKTFGVTLLFWLLANVVHSQVTLTLDYKAKAGTPDTVQSGELWTMQLNYAISSTTAPNVSGVKIEVTVPDFIYDAQGFVGTSHAPVSNFSFSNVAGAKKLTITFVNPVATGSTGVLEFSMKSTNGTTPNNTTFTSCATMTDAAANTSGSKCHNMIIKAAANLCGSKVLKGGGAIDAPTVYRIGLTYSAAATIYAPLGSLNVSNIVVRDTLPTGATYVSAKVVDGFGNTVSSTITHTGDVVTATLPDYVINNVNGTGGVAFLEITVKYESPTFSVGNVVTNKASITYTPFGGTPITLTNGAANPVCTSDLIETTTLVAAVTNANLVKTRANSSPVNSGADLSYNFNFTNTGNVPLDNVEIVDTIPANLTYKAMRMDAFGTAITALQYQTNLNSTWRNWSVPLAQTTAPPPLAAGEKLTVIKFILATPFAAGASLTGTHSIVFTSDIITMPTQVTNCMVWTSTTSNLPANRKACADPYTINPPFPTAKANYRADHSPGCSSYFLNQEVTLSGTLSAVAGYANLENPVVAIYTWDGAQYVPGSEVFTANTSGITTTPTLTVIPGHATFSGKSYTLYRWTFPTGTVLPINKGFSVSVKVKLTNALPGGTPVNVWFVADGSNVSDYEAYNSGVISFTDKKDWNVDGDTTQVFSVAPSGFNSCNLTVAAVAEMESIKWVKGLCDTTYSRFPAFGQTVPGGNADYRLIVKNKGNVTMKDIKIIDILPFIGDKGVIDPQTRNSAWRPNLAGPIAAPAGITVYYSTVGNPCRDEVKQPSASSPFPTGCTPANWTTTPPSDITKVQAVKIDFGTKLLAGGDSLVFNWPMRAPVNSPTNDEIAWNSFGFVATRTDNNQALLAAEPPKVGIKVKPGAPAFYGDRVWFDTNKNGIQDAGEGGVDGIKVKLFSPKVAGVQTPATDSLINFTITGNGGLYKFSNLTPGSYYAVFCLPTGYSVSPKNAAGSNADNDSDGTQTTYDGGLATIVPITTLTTDEEDYSWDQGIFCDFTPAVTSVQSVPLNGSVTLTASGGTTYLWSGPNGFSASTAAITINPVTPADTGTYIVNIEVGACRASLTTGIKIISCVKPVASVTPKVQTICVGGTASAFTATPSTGVQYKWYGPLTSVTGSLETAISGATNATFTPTGTALTTAGAKFYAVVVNTTGDAACADTAFVQLNVSQLSVPAVTAQCHANGTPENGADDYMTFSINVSTTPMSANKFTVTATQAGNPLAVTLSNGSAATAINCGLDTPLRTPAGSAGKGNVTLTITDNVTGCTTTVVVTDPGTCAVTCVQGTPSTVTYEYATQVDVTELNALPIVIPKFDEQGGTRVLKSVKLEYTVGGKTAFIFENRAAQSQTFTAKAFSDATITLNGTDLATNTLEMLIPSTTLPGGILVPATGAWAGDSIPSPAPTPTTLGRMESWVSDYLMVFKDPRTDGRWVTNATGDATDDDDMYVAPSLSDSKSGVFTYTTAGDLAPFIGTGNIPLNVSTLSGLTTSGGGGNLIALERTRAYASAKVTYTYECILCTKPVAVVAPKTQTICAGSPAGVYTATPSTGVEYKWYGPLADTTSSLGTSISGAASATFTPSGAALTTVGTKYYAVVVSTIGGINCADTAFVRLVVNAKPTPVNFTAASVCVGAEVTYPDPATTNGTWTGPGVTDTGTGATVNTTTALTQLGATAPKTFYIYYTQTSSGCTQIDSAAITVKARPVVTITGPTVVCATDLPVTFTGNPAGGTFTLPSGLPAGAVTQSNNVLTLNAGFNIATLTFSYSYTDATTNCSASVSHTITVNPKPNAGSDATAVCQPTKTAKLTAVTTGGTWAPIGSPANPSAASIDANGNITGLNAAGTYKFVYSVTGGGQTCTDTAQVVVNAKPTIADGTAAICAGESVDLTSKITNYATYQSPVWTVGTASGTAVATPTSVKPTSTTTYVLVAQNAAGCKDTANVVVTVNAKPSAGKDTTLVCVNAATNTLATSITLSPSPAGGTWSQIGTTPTTATITGNNVTNMMVAGTYQFIYTTSAGCKDTIAVTVAPCAGCVKPNAGPDAAAVCQPTATAKLTAVTTGGTWAPIGSPANPSAASIDANGNITGLNAAGTYRFVYSITSGGQTCTDTAQVVVNAKPTIADGSAAICAGESVDLTTKIINYNTYLSPVWTVGTASGTAVTTPTSVKPTGTTTYVLVAQNAAGCKDTANVVVTVNPKPNAGKDTTLVCVNAATNTLATSITLSPSPAGGTWSQIGTTPTTATITGNNVTNMTVAGTYQFIYTTSAGCKDTIAVTVAPCAGCVKPNAGSDAAAVCQPTKTAKLTAVTTGGTWAPIGSPANPSAASIDANGNITGLNAAGTYRFVYSITSGGQTCTDTAQVVVNAKPTIADGSAAICAGESVDLTTKITNYNTYLSSVWTVATASGTTVATPTSVKPTGTTTYVLVAQNALGCKDTANVVVTVNAKPSVGKDTTLVCANGNVPSSVQLSATPTGGTWSALTGNPTGATVNSSGLVSITNATAQGKSFNFIYSVNGCQDTVKVIVPTCPPPCIKSTVTVNAPVCSADAQTYSFTFTVNNKLGIVKVNKGTLTGTNPYTVSGIPSGQNVLITDSLSTICKADTVITGVNCNCNPALPQLLTPSLTVCKGDTFPTLKATVVGLATVEWFSQATGGTVLATGLTYKPSGTATANTIFYAQARSTDPTCPTAISTSRVPATINAQSCIDTVDLALKKLIDKKIARVGDVLTYTIKVWNEWTKNATGVEVTDSIATTVQFVSGSFNPSRGNATISGNVIKWTVGNIAANGDTVTLSYQVKATQAGVHLNTAEISKTNEKDRDSTPGNGKGGEDDIDQQCFTVPYGLCAGQKLEVGVPAGLTNVQWFKNGGTTAVATGNVVLLSEVGTYTFTATNKTCPANGCCPVIIEAGTNCCPVDICVPFTVKKIKK